MARKSKVVGIDNFVATFERLGSDSVGISKTCVYRGAELIADAVRAAIKTIPSRDPGERTRTGITQAEREGLLEGLGISTMQVSGGVVDNKIGFDGYNSYITKSYPKGHPNSMVARSIESGTTFLKKTPFIAPTVRRLRASVKEAMQAELDEQIRQRSK